jgi:hypothetical protein
MARGLGDVLHLFDPDLAPAARGGVRAEPDVDLPLVGVGAPAGDLLGLGIAFNLAVELARRGAPASLVLRASGTPLAAEDEGAALGARLVLLASPDPAALVRRAREIARGPDRRAGGGLVLACLGPDELCAALERGELERVLLLTGADRARLRQTEALARRLFAAQPDAAIGVTVHGVRSVAEAREAFERLADAIERDLGRVLVSHGLLVDDLALYRSLVERRPVATSRHQSPAARALADVARLLAEDAAA